MPTAGSGGAVVEATMVALQFVGAARRQSRAGVLADGGEGGGGGGDEAGDAEAAACSRRQVARPPTREPVKEAVLCEQKTQKSKNKNDARVLRDFAKILCPICVTSHVLAHPTEPCGQLEGCKVQTAASIDT